MSRYDLVIKGVSYEVNINGISGSSASVSVNGTPYQVEIKGGVATQAAPLQQATAPASYTPAAPSAPASRTPVPTKPVEHSGETEGEVILSPMPGHILSVTVKVGEHVTPGTTVVVMEAMKMENDIKSHITGTVTEIRVSAGQDVAVNEVLVVIGE